MPIQRMNHHCFSLWWINAHDRGISATFTAHYFGKLEKLNVFHLTLHLSSSSVFYSLFSSTILAFCYAIRIAPKISLAYIVILNRWKLFKTLWDLSFEKILRKVTVVIIYLFPWWLSIPNNWLGNNNNTNKKAVYLLILGF